MTKKLLTVVVLSLTVALGLWRSVAAQEAAPPFEKAECPFTVPFGYRIDCGFVSVPEDRSQPIDDRALDPRRQRVRIIDDATLSAHRTGTSDAHSAQRVALPAGIPKRREDAGFEDFRLCLNPVRQRLPLALPAFFVQLTRAQANLSLQHVDHQPLPLASSGFTVHCFTLPGICPMNAFVEESQSCHF